jgi:hypothetical protein
LKRIIFLIISFFVLLGQPFYSQTENTDLYNTASVSINFYDKTMYYPSCTDTNPVFIHICVKNTGTDTLRFKLADDRIFSIDFNAYTIKNTQLQQTESLIRKRTTNQTVYFREISLESGEEYSFVENIKDYLNIDEPSIYYIELIFYPELYKTKDIKLMSNRLTLEVNPSPSATSSTIIPIKVNTAEILKPEEISPDKVVEQTIIARQKSLWDQYFLYMDIEAMLERTPAAKRKFRSVSANERQQMIEAYKSDLIESRIDGDIVAVPEKFQIEKTVYSQTEGTVLVTEWFNNRTYYEKKSYTYRVRQRDGIWQIYDYTVVNLGTE